MPPGWTGWTGWRASSHVALLKILRGFLDGSGHTSRHPSGGPLEDACLRRIFRAMYSSSIFWAGFTR